MSNCHNNPTDPPPPPFGYRVSHAIFGAPMQWAGISCRHFAVLASIEMDRRLTKSERVRYRAHGLICRFCRKLPGQFAALRELSHAAGESGDLGAGMVLSESVKDHILSEMKRKQG